jgi:hypothetical protein
MTDADREAHEQRIDDATERGEVKRKRKKRPKGWLSKAIKDGSVRDPKLGVEPHQVYPDNVVVVSVPTATIDSAGYGEQGE